MTILFKDVVQVVAADAGVDVLDVEVTIVNVAMAMCLCFAFE